MTEPDDPLGPEGPIRVYLVDDHGVVRKGMRAYLEMVEDIDVVGEAASGEAAVEELRRLAGAGQPPDVVMMDLLMPGMDGIAATGIIRERHPEIEVVALTSFVAQDKVQAALAAGASGYVLKDADADEVAWAIRAAHRGEVHLAPAAARELAKALQLPAPDPEAEPLTDRERQVLALVAEGASNKEIGQALFISERTARTHVSNILMKIGVRSRTQAALWAIREGFAYPSD
ncbi:MAG: response regulator transcription factor [Actinomycetota bacterium]|nr:response regulator transcription factor [Actinomycetota bacterium]